MRADIRPLKARAGTQASAERQTALFSVLLSLTAKAPSAIVRGFRGYMGACVSDRLRSLYGDSRPCMRSALQAPVIGLHGPIRAHRLPVVPTGLYRPLKVHHGSAISVSADGACRA